MKIIPQTQNDSLKRFKDFLKEKEALRKQKAKELEVLNYKLMFQNAPKIKPNRFIWHLSYPSNRQGIFEKGILPSKKYGLVFANNQMLDPFYFFPVAILKLENANEDPEELLACFDYWRIDSQLAGFDGYKVDPYGPNLYTFSRANDEDFICRQKAIPKEALKLFTYKQGSIYSYFDQLNKDEANSKCFFVDGAVSVVMTRRRIDKTKPSYLEEVNMESFYAQAA